MAAPAAGSPRIAPATAAATSGREIMNCPSDVVSTATHPPQRQTSRNAGGASSSISAGQLVQWNTTGSWQISCNEVRAAPLDLA